MQDSARGGVRLCRAAHSTRRSFPRGKDKPLDLFGIYCETTVKNVLHAFQMTVDKWVSQDILGADGVHISVDISTFATYHQQSLYVFAWWVKKIGKDAANNALYIVECVEGFAPSIAVGEKLSRQLLDKDGKLFSTATTRAAATSLILANLQA